MLNGFNCGKFSIKYYMLVILLLFFRNGYFFVNIIDNDEISKIVVFLK